MWIPGSVLSAPALFLAGSAASVHCALMCGAVSAHHARAARPLPLTQSLAWIHCGRVLGYAAFGVLAGAAGQAIVLHLPNASTGRLLQGGAALVLVLIGLRMVVSPRLAPACCQIPTKQPFKHWPLRLELLIRGLLWAAIPCGLLYSVLLLCALSGDFVTGGLLAGAFALGGAPLLAIVGWRGARGGSALSRQGTGWWLIALGLAGLAAILVMPSIGGTAWCGFSPQSAS